MSDIMEKTIASLPSLISGTLTGNKPNTSSRAFQTFIKNLGNLKSRYEEESFMKRELALQKQRLGQPGISSSQTREYLVRLVYCSMLGYDVSFAYIHAIKLAQQGALLDKRAGYLVTAMFLKDSDELVMLLVNTIQKDLRSTNVACMCMALTAAAQLISQEMVPALLPLVEEKLKHPREMVRKKAVLCLLAFYGKARDLLAHGQHRVEAALCDPDPGVMWAALLYYHQLVKADPSPYASLVPTLVGLLEQVVTRRLSSDYEYHSVPAPWLQILLLKVLARLGQDNQSSSQLMYPVLGDILQRTEPSHKIGLAVIYECLMTILSVSPQPALVEHAAKVVGKFLSSKNNNLRYLGIKALTMVVRINPGYAMEHQEAVLDCLEHCDLTIRTKTLDLLYQMANPQNRHVVSERLLHQLSACPDASSRVDMVTKVIALADRFAADRPWFVETVNRAVLLGGPTALPDGIPEKIVAVIPKRTETSEDSRAVHKFCVQTFWTLLHQDGVPDVLLQVAAWVLGELCSVVCDLDLGRVVGQLIMVYLRVETSDRCRAAVLSALIKLSCDVQIPTDRLQDLGRTILPEQTELRQRFAELERVNRLHCDQRVLNTLNAVLKDAVQEQDWSLSFLDNFVAERLEDGVPPYKPTYIRVPSHSEKKRESNSLFVGLNFTPYETPAVTGSVITTSTLNTGNGRAPGSDGLSQLTESTLTNLQLSGVKRVWTKEGVVSSPDKVQVTPPREPIPPAIEEDSGTVRESEDTDLTGSLQRDADTRRREQMAQLFSGIVDTRSGTSVTTPSSPPDVTQPKEGPGETT